MSLVAGELVPVRLKPGELLICREPHEVITVLGSCVAITMFHPRTRLAAICHAMLPAPPHLEDPVQGAAQPFRFVSLALPAMISAFDLAGVFRGEIEVKMFGGANVLASGSVRARHGIGSANVRQAWQILQQEKFRVLASNVGGMRGRKIVFNTRTGHVLHKHLS